MSQTTRKVTLKFTSDPGHGWLHVKRDLARMILGSDFNKISRCSYQRGGTVYLEEDNDALMFIKACGSRGIEIVPSIKYYWKLAPIRSYQAFCP